MTKAEARMTKEGRMTKVEGKGDSDFGLRASFVIRASAFGSAAELRPFIFRPSKKLPGKSRVEKPCFLREKRPSNFVDLRKPRKQAKND
jgi:hypothetical protein